MEEIRKRNQKSKYFSKKNLDKEVKKIQAIAKIAKQIEEKAKKYIENTTKKV